MNYSFNADYREVAKRMNKATVNRSYLWNLIMYSYRLKQLIRLNAFRKWPWC